MSALVFAILTLAVAELSNNKLIKKSEDSALFCIFICWVFVIISVSIIIYDGMYALWH